MAIPVSAPFSLQDTCKLYLLATIDEYPVNILAKLPLHMRKKLFMAMPVIDRMHYQGTLFLDGLEVKHIPNTTQGHSQPDLSDPAFRDSDEVYLCPWLTTDSLKREMINIILPPLSWDCNMIKLCALNFPMGCFNSFDTIIPDHSNRNRRFVGGNDCTSIKSFNLKRCSKERKGQKKQIIKIMNVDSVVVPTVRRSSNIARNDNFIIPSRLCKFIRSSNESYPCQFEFESTHFEAFIEYCKLWCQVPEVLEIDCNEFLLESPLWKYFLTRHAQPDGGHVVYSYLKKLLSSVETLQLSSTSSTLKGQNVPPSDVSLLRDLVLPIIRSCAGHDMKSRHLKQIEITSTRSLEAALDLLTSVRDFLSGNGTRTSDDEGNAVPDDHQCPAPPDLNHYEPYLIESLSIVVDTKVDTKVQQRSETNSEVEAKSRSLMKILGDVLIQQLRSLKHFAVKLLIKIHEIDSKRIERFSSRPVFWRPCTESVYTIMPTLIDFIRRPQFHSVALNVLTPDLYRAFITTPATHDQLLAIDSIWTEKPKAHTPETPLSIPTDQPQPPYWADNINSSDIPFSNLKFKSLDLGSFDCQLNREAIAVSPILRLKMLHIPFDDLMAVHNDAIIEVSHVKIDMTETRNWSNDLLSDYVEISRLFLGSNQYLSTLELFPRKLVTLPLVNHCLEQIIRAGPIPLYGEHCHNNGSDLNEPIRTLTLHSVHLLCTPILALPLLRQMTLEEIHMHLDTPLSSYVMHCAEQQDNPLSVEQIQEISSYNQPLLKLFTLIRILGESRVTQRLVVTANDNIISSSRGVAELRKIVEQLSGDGRVKQIVLKGYSVGDNLSADLGIFELIAEEVVIDS